MISIEEARALYRGADAAHDFDHVLRVLALAEYIGQAEGADMRVVRAAALLHDLARVDDTDLALDATPETDHARLAARQARLLLADQPTDFVEAVAHAIEAHRFRNDVEPRTLEAKALFDADKLDSIGAVGVARAFVHGALHGQRMWGEVPPDYRPSGHREHTAHHEFHVKLKHVRDRLYTETGRRLAEARHHFMVEFFERMALEVRGEA